MVIHRHLSCWRLGTATLVDEVAMTATTKVLAGAASALILISAAAQLPAIAQSSRVVSSKISPPKLASTKVTETRRVSTEVGRPKVVTQVTRVATSVQRISASSVGARSVLRSANSAAELRSTPRAKIALTTTQAVATVAPASVSYGQGHQAWRDLSRTQFRTGDFFDRQ
jgi:hypothetical protein